MTSRSSGTGMLERINFENFEWKTRLNSTKILPKHELARVRVDIHPLHRFLSQINNNETVGQPNVQRDPLGNLDGNDPLSLLQRQSMNNFIDTDIFDDSDTNDNPSTSSGLGIRRKRITNSRGMKAILNIDDFNTDITIDIKRLKIELSDHLAFDEEFLRSLRRLKPNDLIARIDHFRVEMIRKWDDEERVEALRIVILCAKLLMDTENPVLYPIKYVHFADVFDEFRDRVYQRLKSRAEPPSSVTPLQRQHSSEPIPSKPPGSAKETCLNWFSKIASIRELVPRLYAEAALLRCYSFLDEERIAKELKKLIKLTRAVGDLVVNLYLRCYMCQVAMECRLLLYNFFRESFDDFMISLSAFLRRDDIDDPTNLHRYLETLLPGLEWLLKGIIDRDYNIQEMFLRFFRAIPNGSIMLLAILQGFEEGFIVEKITYIMEWLSSPVLADVPKYRYLISLGRLYENVGKKSADSVPEEVLKTVWHETESLNDTNEYLNVVELWLPLSEKCLPNERVNKILQVFGPHVAREQFVDRHYTRVENVVRNLTRYADDFFMLLISENFLPFLNMIPNAQFRVTVCKIILESLVHRSDYTFICDSVTLDSLMIVAKTVHDSIRMSTVDDELKQIGNLIAKFVRLVRFGDEFDKQLDFYVEARKIFYQLDVVMETLVHSVNCLCFERLKSVKGNHDSRSLEFAHSCVAYNFITIPSLRSPIARLQLLIISGQVALANQCLDMASAYFIEAISTFKMFNNLGIELTSYEKVRIQFTRNPHGEVTFNRDTTSYKETILKSYALQLMSILIVLPDDPDNKTVFRMCSRLVRAIKEFEWRDPTIESSLTVMLMRMYSVGYQEVYPYHFLNVDSNDTLYGPDALFRQKIDIIINTLMQDVLRSIVQLSEQEHYVSQMIIFEQLFACILAFGDLTNKSLAVLSVQLWNFCQQIPSSTKVFMKNWISFCLHMTPPESPYEFLLQKIKFKLKLDDITLVGVGP